MLKKKIALLICKEQMPIHRIIAETDLSVNDFIKLKIKEFGYYSFSNFVELPHYQTSLITIKDSPLTRENTLALFAFITE